MALEAAIFPQDSFSYCGKEWYAMVGGTWSFGISEPEAEKGMVAVECEMGDGSGNSSGGADQRGEPGRGVSDSAHGNWGPFCSSVLKSLEEWEVNSSSPETCVKEGTVLAGDVPAATAASEARRKRRRTKSCKNREEVENQRMTHIAVERNRRKQMNEYLSVLRSLMPPSYVQRGDQASIVGGAINFVKELEQQLQSLEAQTRIKQQQQQQQGHANAAAAAAAGSSSSSPFSWFFTFPQYSSSGSLSAAPKASPSPSATRITGAAAGDPATENRPAVADIEVTMVESHANLRLLSRQRPKQLRRLVAGLQGLRLAVLHLNVTTTVDQMVLYSFSLKVEEDCQLSSVDEIAAAVHQMLGKIQEEAGF